jgi:hypothetical protein
VPVELEQQPDCDRSLDLKFLLNDMLKGKGYRSARMAKQHSVWILAHFIIPRLDFCSLKNILCQNP